MLVRVLDGNHLRRQESRTRKIRFGTSISQRCFYTVQRTTIREQHAERFVGGGSVRVDVALGQVPHPTMDEFR